MNDTGCTSNPISAATRAGDAGNPARRIAATTAACTYQLELAGAGRGRAAASDAPGSGPRLVRTVQQHAVAIAAASASNADEPSVSVMRATSLAVTHSVKKRKNVAHAFGCHTRWLPAASRLHKEPNRRLNA